MRSSSRLRRGQFRLEQLEDRSVPALITVSNLDDSGPGSLRAAIDTANQDIIPDNIVFAPTIRGGTINLTTFTNPTTGTPDNGQPVGPSAFVVRSAVTIEGTGESIS